MENEDPNHEEINQDTEKNLVDLVNFLLRLAGQSNASSVKIYRWDIQPIPLKACMAYYRDTQAVQDDLLYMEEIWERGLPRHKLGPMKDCPPDVLKKYVHPRDEAWKNRMLGELNKLLPIQAMPTAEDLRAVLASNRHDHFYNNECFATLDYPFYMNSMVDKFYTDLLKQAAGMKLDS